MSNIFNDIRQRQQEGEELGSFFTALYTFAERTMDSVWPKDHLPSPLIELDSSLRGDGCFTWDVGLNCPKVSLNPSRLRNGTDAAETLVHELIHYREYMSTGQPLKNNYHNAHFHNSMESFAILTKGRNGVHIGFTDDGLWTAWMKQNADLHLDQFILPGMNQTTKRRMYKGVCPKCDAKCRARVKINITCTDCGVEFTWAR